MPSERISDPAWVCALYELGQHAANGLAPEQVQQVQQDILQHIVRGLDAESGSIALTLDNSDELEIVAGIDLPAGTIGRRLERGVGVFGRIVASGKPLLINDGPSGADAAASHGEQRSVRSAMCWPLFVGEKTIGALAVNRGAGSVPFTTSDLEDGQSVTALLALVMANHRMHLERDHRIVELSALNARMLRLNAVLEDTQNQVIQADKLASIGQIAAGVAHEINNPLAFVLSNVGTMDAYVTTLFELVDAYVAADGDDASAAAAARLQARALLGRADLDFLRDDARMLVAETRDGLQRVKRIVQDLNNFSRGNAEESWQLVDLHAALDSTLNIMGSEIKHRVRIETRYGSMPDVECRPSRLNQVFLNLLVNAGQSIEGGGTITVTTGSDDNEVWICVEDTGCGIAPEHQKRLFEPFFTTKPVGEGTGLGLSVSHAIVRKHGGSIDVDSVVGRGSRFTVRLPIRQNESVSAAAPPAPEVMPAVMMAAPLPAFQVIEIT